MNTTTNTASASNGMLAVGGIGLIVSLGIVLMKLMSEGHSAFATTANIPWGLPISTYLFFVLASTGLTFVAALSMVFGIKGFYPIAKRSVWLAIITLIAGFAALGLEIGHPFRMIWTFPAGMQFRSPMFWMGVFYTADLVLLLFKFQKMNADDWDSGASRQLGVASFVAVVLAQGTLGSVFGMMAMRPFWYDGLVPVFFLVTAALSGAAFVVLFIQIAYRGNTDSMPLDVKALMTGAMPKVFAAVLGVYLVFTIARTATGLWSNLEGNEVFRVMYGSMLFHFEFWIGLVVPFFILINGNLRNQATMQILASALVILALFIGRYEFVIMGQMVPMFKGQWTPGLASYMPGLAEWMLVVLAVSITLFLYALGARMFDLSGKPKS
ncbi:MAG: polysulfide reductase NrfD [Rhodospirillales bacterium]|nr:polysulfide reductase NrfD [Rhodospirillales bacterium]